MMKLRSSFESWPTALSLDHLVHVLKTFSTVDVKRDLVSTLPLEMALVESSIAPKPPVVQAAPAPAASAAPTPARQGTAPARQPVRQQQRTQAPSGPPPGKQGNPSRSS